MTEQAKELLKKLVNKYKKTNENTFNCIDCLEFSNETVDELEMLGCIERNGDVVDSFILTEKVLRK